MTLTRCEFEGGHLVKIDGMRPEYMSGQQLIELVRELAGELRNTSQPALTDAHFHVRGDNADACARCGKDLRDGIHIRLGATA